MKKILLGIVLVLLAANGYAQNALNQKQHDAIYPALYKIRGVQWGPILQDTKGKFLRYANCISVKEEILVNGKKTYQPKVGKNYHVTCQTDQKDKKGRYVGIHFLNKEKTLPDGTKKDIWENSSVISKSDATEACKMIDGRLPTKNEMYILRSAYHEGEKQAVDLIQRMKISDLEGGYADSYYWSSSLEEQHPILAESLDPREPIASFEFRDIQNFVRCVAR